ncbi:MAG: PIN domain-containing protein [Acidobacteria bacterium]|nr:PIN domain-containing protein [Acidobacteriota bacterium]
MTVFVDTSAFLALLDADEARHADAVATWEQLTERAIRLTTTNYVIVETLAVVQNRLGLGAVRSFVQDVLPAVDLLLVDAELHDAATSALLAAGRRQLSLVDCASFSVMRRERLEQAFAFNRHFAEQGFRLGESGK